ncbi:MAG: hypothetical protein VYB34_15490, partial [Planctomycetota bacterium]|nr:hypothetical protein [Planctomycetota bacterium]
MRSLHTFILLAALALTACGDATRPLPPDDENKQAPEKSPAQTKPAGAAKTDSDHGDRTDLGTLSVAGNKFHIFLLGKLTPGEEGAFEVSPQGASAEDISKWNLFLWVEDKAGAQLSAPAKGSVENSTLHFHVTPRKAETTPTRVVLRFRFDGTDERAGLPLDGHGHEHIEGPHHGVPAEFTTGGDTGQLELKLHDDKGDLELWLFRDKALTSPFDLPLASSVEIEFIDVDGRKVSLHPRNTEKNEDEAGEPNVRDGGTNYFIYPSKEGEDASWLKGKAFQSIVIVRFSLDGKESVSE